MRLFALCNKYFQWSAFFSRNYPLNQDVSPSPHNFLHVLWHFPGHFLLRRQFLHVLRPKQGCFSTAAAISPGIVAFSGTFFFRGGFFSWICGVFRDIFFCGGSFSMFYPQNQDVSLPPHNFLLELWRFSGHSFAGKNISLTLWGIKQDFFNEDI